MQENVDSAEVNEKKEAQPVENTEKVAADADKSDEEKTEGAEVKELKSESKEKASKSKKEKKQSKKEEKKAAKEKNKEEKVDYQSKFLYLAAEMENMRKRHSRDREDFIKYGNERILKELLEVMDNFDRSISAIEKDEDEKVKSICEGMIMVRKQFLDALSNNGLEAIETEGKEFDPNFHEAMTRQEAEGKKENEIVMEYQKGYMLNGRLLRASKVVVAK